MWGMVLIYSARLKYLRNGISMLLKYVGNVLEILEMAKIFGKWLRYMRHGLSI